MAYTTQTTFKGFQVNSYNKITGFSVTEEPVDGVKKYAAKVQVNVYTDSTKEYDIEQFTKDVKGLDLVDLTLETLYTKIKPVDGVDA